MLGDLVCTVFDLTVSGFNTRIQPTASNGGSFLGGGDMREGVGMHAKTRKKNTVTSVADTQLVMPTIPSEHELNTGVHELVIVDLTTTEDAVDGDDMYAMGPFTCARSWCRMNVDPKEILELYNEGGGHDCTYHPGKMFEVRWGGQVACVCVCVCVCVLVGGVLCDRSFPYH